MKKELLVQAETTRQLILETVLDGILKTSNQSTALELRNTLRRKAPLFYWTEELVNAILTSLVDKSILSVVDSGTKIYSKVKGAELAKVEEEIKLTAADIKKSHISRTQALKLMQNNRGHFFTVQFIDKDENLRTMNAQYLADQGEPRLGYVKVRETNKLAKGEPAIRNVNLQTLQVLSIQKKTFNVG